MKLPTVNAYKAASKLHGSFNRPALNHPHLTQNCANEH